MYVIVMFEPAGPGENLKLSEQVNEIFGPFEDEEVATRWMNRMYGKIPNRQWLITDLSNPNVVMKFDVAPN
jgi:hypothetical protein